MTTIEERALALVNAHRRDNACSSLQELWHARAVYGPAFSAVREALEELDAERAAHADFRQEVSDAVEEAMSELVKVGDAATRAVLAHNYFARFLIPKPKPKPDQLVEVAREMVLLDGVVRTDNQKAAIREGRAANTAADDFYDRLRAALAARGLKLVEVGDAD